MPLFNALSRPRGLDAARKFGSGRPMTTTSCVFFLRLLPGMTHTAHEASRLYSDVIPNRLLANSATAKQPERVPPGKPQAPSSVLLPQVISCETEQGRRGSTRDVVLVIHLPPNDSTVHTNSKQPRKMVPESPVISGSGAVVKRVLITGGAGQISYALIPHLISGKVSPVNRWWLDDACLLAIDCGTGCCVSSACPIFLHSQTNRCSAPRRG